MAAGSPSQTAAAPASARADERPRNVIFLITDGMGPASMTLARDYVRHTEGRAELTPDAHFVGSVATAASDNRVTDSAASATAYSAGQRTYNGAVGVDVDGRPIGTILEAAQARGMKTGLVATTRITHATPAAFSAHVPRRSMENEIASQQAALGVDVLIGGGRRHFEPMTTPGSRRTDERDLLAELRQAGYAVALTRDELEAHRSGPVAALLAQDQLSYEIDRPASEPSLAEMTAHALRLLSDDPDGFFLMVEASRIDHAGHGNDPAAHLHDILAFEEAWDVAMAFAQANEGTLVVSTADHETGGLTIGRDGVYAWEPDVLTTVTASVDTMSHLLAEGLSPADVLERTAGIDDLTDEERAALDEAARDNNPRELPRALVHLISDRAGLGWTSGGHTAVDVNVYAYGPGAERLAGHRANDAFGRTLAGVMGLDLEAQTARLNDRSEP